MGLELNNDHPSSILSVYCRLKVGKKRNVLLLSDKLKVIEMLEKGDTERVISEKLSVSKSQVNRISKSQARALRECELRGISNFKASDGWFRNWRGHFGIGASVRLFGEAGDVNLSEVEPKMQDFRRKLIDFKPGNIFSMDGTALFFKALPSSSYISVEERGRENVRGTKPDHFVILRQFNWHLQSRSVINWQFKTSRTASGTNIRQFPTLLNLAHELIVQSTSIGGRTFLFHQYGAGPKSLPRPRAKEK